MKRSSLLVCAGALLVMAPLVLGAYQTHEVAATLQEFAAANYPGHVNFGTPMFRVWQIIACVLGVLLVFAGVLIEAVARKAGQPSRHDAAAVRG